MSLEAADPVVTLEAPAVRSVRVITMEGDAEAPAIAGLPIVITPRVVQGRVSLRAVNGSFLMEFKLVKFFEVWGDDWQ